MIELISKYDCCGCTACESVCHKKAISMQADDLGFLYPVVNHEKCINCGLCDTVCPVSQHNIGKYNRTDSLIYALRNKDKNICHSSSSGGVFLTLCDYVIDKGGVVFGAEYENNFVVKHKFEDKKEDVKRMSGSKYVQSDIRGVFFQAKQFLNEGRLVLFSGTPCQIEGLKLYLRKEYDKLITVDILCHGVPSPKVFSDYINFIGKNSVFKLTHINMKDKTFGWEYQNLRLYFGNHKSQFNTIVSNLWNKIYYSHIVVRPSCFKCHFTNYNRTGDFSIGDFWGINKYHPDFDISNGASLLMVNTIKGNEVWNDIKVKFYYAESDKEKCKQQALLQPVQEPENIDIILKRYYNEGFSVFEDIFNITRLKLIKNKLFHLLSNLKK